ncbi:hypothetical protein DNTS_018410 [Danionella cerebrum]|uniref:Uncharacterized protein n=1 Tax=Danionella cerebrum TaxID=2873325 RepID=A0A553REE5_9TELE|nr:hypothetical protein DNTS_018410 [Danionella translucida]
MHHGNRPQVAGVFEAVEFVSCAPALASHSRFPLADCQSKAVPVTAHRTSAQLDPSADSPVTHGDIIFSKKKSEPYHVQQLLDTDSAEELVCAEHMLVSRNQLT